MSNIDLHSHVIPPTIVAAIEREPERFGMRFELKDGKRYFNAPGRKIELMPGFCDVDAKIEWMDEFYLRNFIGFPLDTTMMVAHLMFSGALGDLKKLRILLAHGGGYVPYQIGRFVHGFNARPEAKTKTRSSPRDLLRRFYFDSLLHDPVAVRHLINRVGADRVVIGTDHPFDMAPDNPVPEIDAIPQLSASEREYVCELTALELLGED